MMRKSRTGLFAIFLAGALGLIFFATGSAFAAPPAGTISYWKLDEGTLASPAVYLDSITATANDGQDNGTPPTEAAVSVVGTALQFDGGLVGTGIDVPADDSFNWAVDQSFSIECWVRRNGALAAANEVVVGRDDNGGNLQWWVGIWGTGGGGTAQTAAFVLFDTGGVAGDTLSGTTIVAGPGAVVQGAWHHIVAVRDADAGEIYLYVDGAQVPEDTGNPVFTGGFASADDLTIGYLNNNGVGSNFTGGAVDEVALYSRALTPAEVQEHYDAGLAGNGIDTLVDDDDADDDNGGGGGGSSGGGCFIGTVLSD